MTCSRFFIKTALLLLSILFVHNNIYAQTTGKAGKPLKTAQVEVVVLDAASKPRANEEMVFTAAKGPKKFRGRTNQSGLLKIQLPVADDYAVMIKAMADSNQYASLSIPALADGEEFTAPFKIEIIYEPARHFTLNNVHFDINKATLRPDSFKELNELADYLKWRMDDKVEIAGHTDNVGKAEDNIVLSEQRANTVRTYLLKKGIEPSRVIAKGYGASQPVAENSTEEGRQKNRRTEVRLID